MPVQSPGVGSSPAAQRGERPGQHPTGSPRDPGRDGASAPPAATHKNPHPPRLPRRQERVPRRSGASVFSETLWLGADEQNSTYPRQKVKPAAASGPRLAAPRGKWATQHRTPTSARRRPHVARRLDVSVPRARVPRNHVRGSARQPCSSSLS